MINGLPKFSKIICIIPDYNLYKGDIFEVEITELFDIVVFITSIDRYYPSSYFITLEEYRNNKLNIILND